MEFIYLEEKKRMCQKERAMCSGCSGCALNPQNLIALEEVCYNCSNVEWLYPDIANELVRDWAETHPRMTRADHFFSVFPNADYLLFDDGFKRPKVCAKSLGYTETCYRGNDSAMCTECWREKYNVAD
jgi:hypothetical protein